MTLVDSIIATIENNESSEIDILRSKMKSKKTLSKVDFSKLIEIIKKQAIEILSIQDLTLGECELIGKAMMAAKLYNIDEIIKFVVMNMGKRTALFLNCLLNKKCKIDTKPVEDYVSKMLLDEVHLCHLKLLFTISKNYPNLINGVILDFCDSNQHPICQEILKRHKIDLE